MTPPTSRASRPPFRSDTSPPAGDVPHRAGDARAAARRRSPRSSPSAGVALAAWQRVALVRRRRTPDTRSELERALALVREAESPAPDRRRARRAARAAARATRDVRARATTPADLAWSEPAPSPDALAALVDRVEREVAVVTRSRSPTRARFAPAARAHAARACRARSRCASPRSLAAASSSSRHPHTQTIVALPRTRRHDRRARPLGEHRLRHVLAHRRDARRRSRAATAATASSSSPTRRTRRCRRDRRRPISRRSCATSSLPQATAGLRADLPREPVDGHVQRRNADLDRARARTPDRTRASCTPPAVVLVSDLDDDPARPARARIDHARLPARRTSRCASSGSIRRPETQRSSSGSLGPRSPIVAGAASSTPATAAAQPHAVPVDARRARDRRRASRSPRTSCGRRGSSGSQRDEEALRLVVAARARRARRPRRAARGRRSRLAARRLRTTPSVAASRVRRRRHACRRRSPSALLGVERRRPAPARDRSSFEQTARRRSASTTRSSVTGARARGGDGARGRRPRSLARARRRPERCSASSRSAISRAAAGATRARPRPRVGDFAERRTRGSRRRDREVRPRAGPALARRARRPHRPGRRRRRRRDRAQRRGRRLPGSGY